MTNLYDLLGVDRGATTAEIRAAYVELMKRHHPDISHHHDGSAPFDYVAQLNAAFAILRDHRARANYDMQMRHIPAAKLVAVAHPLPVRQRSRNHHSRLFALFTVGAAVAAAAAVSLADLSPLGRFVAPARDWAIADIADHGVDPSITLQPEEARRIVAAAIALSDEDAEGSSRRCFTDAMATRRPDAAAACVVFDNAVLLWNWRGGDEGSVAPYFQLRNARARHLDALSEWRGDADKLLVRLWSATLDLMVNQVRAAPVVPPSAELVARVNATAPPVAPDAGTIPNPIMARP